MRSRHTRPERLLARELRLQGLNFAHHCSQLPGTPDIVFGDERIAVFVHGCYWHRHVKCQHANLPSLNSLAWARRFSTTVQRDQLVLQELRRLGWRPFVAWECEINASPKTIGDNLRALVGREGYDGS